VNSDDASSPSSSTANLKQRTAGAVKWNVVDKLATQVLYAVTGIVLARLLTQEDYGLVGAVLVFQAFASLLVDSGFAAALIQRKAPTERDYSTVFWFNMLMSVGIYAVLWFAAPLIARCFQNDVRLIWLSRAMFLTFILNASGIVQNNRMVKQMNMRPVVIANALGLIVGGIVGIYLAVTRRDAWALVWQSVVTAGTKSAVLWIIVRWRPMFYMSWQILRGFFAVGAGVMVQSFLNTLFQNIYSFIIGNRLGMVSLGLYSQADKWSKMGSASFSAILTSSFLPALSAVQDDPERLHRVLGKTGRASAYLLFFLFGWLIIAATPIFHLLFGTKWDGSIVMFQILLMRGVFIVLTGLYCNYILAVGRTRMLVVSEVVRDSVALAALVGCFPFLHHAHGVEIMLLGQLGAAVVSYAVTLGLTVRATGRSTGAYLFDLLPYIGVSIPALAAACALVWWLEPLSPLAAIAASAVASAGIYIAINALAGSTIQREVFNQRNQSYQSSH
jgi:O-antigen/teichoic acid export membrane protein